MTEFLTVEDSPQSKIPRSLSERSVDPVSRGCGVLQLKTKRKIKLADAVIAATALLNNLILATRNVDDFKEVKELQIINPFDEEDKN